MDMFKQVTTKSRNWAAYGLSKSRTALENSAVRLKATADLLGTWENKLTAEAQDVSSAVAADAAPDAKTDAAPAAKSDAKSAAKKEVAN